VTNVRALLLREVLHCKNDLLLIRRRIAIGDAGVASSGAGGISRRRSYAACWRRNGENLPLPPP